MFGCKYTLYMLYKTIRKQNTQLANIRKSILMQQVIDIVKHQQVPAKYNNRTEI